LRSRSCSCVAEPSTEAEAEAALLLLRIASNWPFEEVPTSRVECWPKKVEMKAYSEAAFEARTRAHERNSSSGDGCCYPALQIRQYAQQKSAA
jgi:hypothetical protein